MTSSIMFHQMRKCRFAWVPALCVSSTIGFLSVTASAATPVPVEVWRGGDDGLTSSLADAVEKAFNSSSDFALSTGKKRGTIVVTIPTNVDWTKTFGRVKVIYRVTFDSADGKRLGARSGSCWESALQKCARQIVREATKISGGARR